MELTFKWVEMDNKQDKHVKYVTYQMIHAKEKNKKRKRKIGVINLDRTARESPTEKVTFMSKPECQGTTLKISTEREFPAKGTARTTQIRRGAREGSN